MVSVSIEGLGLIYTFSPTLNTPLNSLLVARKNSLVVQLLHDGGDVEHCGEAESTILRQNPVMAFPN